MAIALEERFLVAAPPRTVWALLFDPRRVVACVPGGELTRLVDERTFDGRLRVRVGFLTFAYGGRLRVADADPVARRVRIVGGAHERSGSGTARLTLVSRLEAVDGGATAVVVLAHVDVGGRVAALGAGLLQRLAHEVFLDFAGHVREALARASDGRAAAGVGARAAAVVGSGRGGELAAGARRDGPGGGARRGATAPGGGGTPEDLRGPALHAVPIAARALRRWVGGWWRIRAARAAG